MTPFYFISLFAAVSAAQPMPGYSEPRPAVTTRNDLNSEPAPLPPNPSDSLPDWVLKDTTGSFLKPAAADNAPPAADDLPDWVVRNSTGSFSVQNREVEEDASLLSASTAETTAVLTPPATESAPIAAPAEEETTAPPARASGHGDQRRAAQAAAPTGLPRDWTDKTSPTGETQTDLTEAFLSAMANARPLASRAVSRPRGDDSDLGQRAAFERSLEARVDTLLNAMLGPGLAHAFVRAKVETIPGSGLLEMKEKREEAAALWDEIQGRLKETPPVLPGYPLPHSLKAEVLSRVARTAAPVRSPDRSRAVVTVSLLVDYSVDEKTLTPVTAAVADTLGLDPDRGDILQVTRASIRPTWGRLLRSERTRGAILIALCAVLGAGIPLGAAWFLKGGPGESRRTRRTPRRAASLAPEVNFDPAPYWNDRRYAQAVADFLAQHPPESTAALLGLLSHDAAGAVFRNLPEGQRRRVVSLLSSGGSLGAEELLATGQLRKRLREHLASYARGPGLIEELLIRAPERVRDGLIGDIRRAEPKLAAKISRRIPSLRDLSKANENSLRLCLSVFSTQDLVCAFYEFDEGARERMLEALPLLIREEIRKELSTFVPDSMEVVESARAAITARWRRLELEGRVTSFLAASANSV